MIIVKLTILSVVITVIYLFAVRVWIKGWPREALTAQMTGKYPKWLYGLPLFMFFGYCRDFDKRYMALIL